MMEKQVSHDVLEKGEMAPFPLGRLRGRSDVGNIEGPSEKRRLVPPGALFLQSLILRPGLVDGWVQKVPPP